MVALLLFFFIAMPLSIIAGIFGSKRHIGFFIAFALSIFFTPIIGFICVALSERKKIIEPEEKKYSEPVKINHPRFF